MPRYSYALSASNPPTNVESLTTPLNPPVGRFYEASAFLDQANGHSTGQGFPYAVWKFEVLTQAMIDQLRLICPGYSAAVYLTTRKLNGQFATYSGIMLWPAEQMEKREMGGKYLGLEFTFRRLQAV